MLPATVGASIGDTPHAQPNYSHNPIFTNKGQTMREHYKPLRRRSALFDYALAIAIGLVLASLLFNYL